MEVDNLKNITGMMLMVENSFVIDDEKYFSRTNKLDEKFRKLLKDMEKEFEEFKKKEE